MNEQTSRSPTTTALRTGVIAPPDATNKQRTDRSADSRWVNPRTIRARISTRPTATLDHRTSPPLLRSPSWPRRARLLALHRFRWLVDDGPQRGRRRRVAARNRMAVTVQRGRHPTMIQPSRHHRDRHPRLQHLPSRHEMPQIMQPELPQPRPAATTNERLRHPIRFPRRHSPIIGKHKPCPARPRPASTANVTGSRSTTCDRFVFDAASTGPSGPSTQPDRNDTLNDSDLTFSHRNANNCDRRAPVTAANTTNT